MTNSKKNLLNYVFNIFQIKQQTYMKKGILFLFLMVGVLSINVIAQENAGLELPAGFKANLLIYLRSETDDILKIYTKNGLEYTEPKLNNITKFQDIFYDGNYVYYRENNHVYRFDENVVYYNWQWFAPQSFFFLVFQETNNLFVS